MSKVDIELKGFKLNDEVWFIKSDQQDKKYISSSNIYSIRLAADSETEINLDNGDCWYISELFKTKEKAQSALLRLERGDS